VDRNLEDGGGDKGTGDEGEDVVEGVELELVFGELLLLLPLWIKLFVNEDRI
jgi:hypothetical protein